MSILFCSVFRTFSIDFAFYFCYHQFGRCKRWNLSIIGCVNLEKL
nr:MAG TPA: hypothetical protein [Caudoviricetes sp.]